MSRRALPTAPPTAPTADAPAAPIRIGISTCLLGEEVRFDGGHKRHPFLIETVGRFVEWVPVCPEMGIGLGTPRESLRLVRDGAQVRLVAPKSGTDHTAAMRRFAARTARQLERQDLVGYVLKKDSPTCGMERVRVYDENGVPKKDGRGLYAEVLLDAFPLLPVEEEGRLNDPHLRENFWERVFAYRRLRDLLARRWTVGDLVRFHTAEKLLLMAHDLEGYRELGRLVASAKGQDRADLGQRYARAFMTALRRQATTKKHTNVLQHCQGYFKKLATPDEKAELGEVIEDFRQGLIPLVVPVTLIRHHVRKHGVEYLQGQTYLEPHPRELMLRNHV